MEDLLFPPPPMMSERQPTAALDAEDGWCWIVSVCECVCQIKIAAVSLNQLGVAKTPQNAKKKIPNILKSINKELFNKASTVKHKKYDSSTFVNG